MSLDVTLVGKNKEVPCECDVCGHTHSRESRETFYESNITHNLGTMATQAGIYEALWRPHRLKEGYNIPKENHQEEYKFENENPSTASEIIPILTTGLIDLIARPEHFKQFNPENGWGKYETLVEFVTEYLQACMEYPDATILISR